MKTFAIYGAVVDTDEQRGTFEDVTPTQLRAFAKDLDDGEELRLQINSPGGSVYGGLAIANMLRQLSAQGHRTTAVVEGVAASIASVIMCACDKVVMSESSLCMIHNCWTTAEGDSNALRKQADTMDVMNDAIVSFYKSKFDLPVETLKKMMDEETWFSGREAAEFKFDCEVTPDEGAFDIAARIKAVDVSKFMNAPKALKEIIMEKAEETKAEIVSEVVSEVSETANETASEPVNETVQAAEPVVEQPEPALEVEEDDAEQPAEDMVPKAECEKRVQGMQSAMAKQINELRREYDAKIKDFEVQMKAKDEELAKAKAEATSLSERLTKAEGELSETASALKAKTDALDALNAGVNTPNDGLPTMREGLAKCSGPAERSAFLASGRWRRG